MVKIQNVSQYYFHDCSYAEDGLDKLYKQGFNFNSFIDTKIMLNDKFSKLDADVKIAKP